MKVQIQSVACWLLGESGESGAFARMLAMGALIWGLYSAAQLLVNGIVIDEVVVPAQIITGAVRYPPGHPHQIAYSQLYNLPNYLAAALWKIVPSALFVSAIRNFLFLFSSTFVAFAVTVLLTRQPLWGHFAATLTVTETVLRLMGVYPLWVFPFGYSHGHLGLQVAVLTVVCLLARCWRLGGLLLGLLPGIHAAMATVVWPWSFCYLFFLDGRPQGRDRSRLVAAICGGIVICVLLGFVVFLQAKNAVIRPPYDVQASGELIHRNFTSMTDVHRRLFPFPSIAYLVNPVAFFAIGGLLWWDARGQRTKDTDVAIHYNLLWLLLFGAVTWVWVYGAGLIQILAGTLPAYLERLMPYRFSNITAVLLLPLTAAGMARAFHALTKASRTFALGLVTTLVGIAAILLWLEEGPVVWLYRGRVARHLIFATWGVLFALDLFIHWRQPKRRRLLNLLATAVLFGGMFVMFPEGPVGAVFLTSYVLVALLLVVGAWILHRVQRDWQQVNSFLVAVLLCACALTCAAALRGRRVDPWERHLERWDMFSQYDRELKKWLGNDAAPQEMILPVLSPPTELESKTGHPVLMEWETPYLMTYMPNLAPAIGMMLRDLFGIDYSDPVHLTRIAQNGRVELETAWIETWKRRRQVEWEQLGRKYGFRLVLSLNTIPLDLPVALAGSRWTLYVIPARQEPLLKALLRTSGTRKDDSCRLSLNHRASHGCA